MPDSDANGASRTSLTGEPPVVDPHPRLRVTRASELGIVALLFAVVSIVAAWRQQITLIRFWDSDEYYWMTYYMATHQPIQAEAPYVYRLLTPWLASFFAPYYIARAYPFYVINVTAALSSSMLLIVWLRRFVGSATVRILMAAMFIAAWHGPARFVYYYPMYVDPLLFPCLLGGMLLIERFRRQPSIANLAAITIVCFVGTLCRETMAMVPVSFLFVDGAWGRDRSLGRSRRPIGRWLMLLAPLAASASALIFARLVAHPVKVQYSTLGAAITQLRTKPIYTWLLAWFTTFGPALSILAFRPRQSTALLRDRPYLAVYLILCGIGAFIGGTDTERLLFWGMPVVYLLIARALSANRAVFSSVPLAGMLTVAQVVSERLLWSIPNPGTNVAPLSDARTFGAKAYGVMNRLIVIDDFHWNLWSNFGSRPWHAALLLYDVAFCCGMIWWMRARAHHLAAGHSAPAESLAPAREIVSLS
jgi:hypothetical protein